MKEIVIIGNKKAGKGELAAELVKAQETLKAWPLQIFTPHSAEEFSKILSNLNPEKTKAVIALGGDGTQNLTLKSLSEKQIPLIPFPLGTANDLALSIGLRQNWNQVKQLLEQEKIQSIDLLNLGGHLFCTGGGLGLGADLLQAFNQQRKESGKTHFLHRLLKGHIYTFLSVKIILKKWGQGHRLEITSDQMNQEITTAALFICNQPLVGKDLLVAPKADTQDGKMDVMIIPYSSDHHILLGLTQMKMGRLPETFISFQTKKITIKNLGTKSPLYFGDGEIFPLTNEEITCEVSPLKLKVFNF